jgi:hypothetical protein
VSYCTIYHEKNYFTEEIKDKVKPNSTISINKRASQKQAASTNLWIIPVTTSNMAWSSKSTAKDVFTLTTSSMVASLDALQRTIT